jgi:hypothetical protein
MRELIIDIKAHMKLLTLAFVLFFAVVLSNAATCTHDLEVLCIDDINKGIQLSYPSLPHL